MSRSPLIFLSAGEVSGDMHGAYLAEALRARRPDVRLCGIGSTRMAAAGVEVLADVTAHSAVGLSEQLPHVLPVAKAFREARRTLEAQRPDVVVLIDFQGANMALAAHARKLGLPTVYYIAPQEWLWGLRGGPGKVAKGVDHLLAVFAREAEVYTAAGGRVSYIGHPLVDIVGPPPEHAPTPGDAPVVALLPGSRPQEVAGLLPLFLSAADLLAARHPALRFELPVASEHLRAAIAPLLSACKAPVTLASGGSLALLRRADAALAASGTATLEATLCDVPCVAAYKVSSLTAFLARRLLKVSYVTLPNIVAEASVIPELLQGDAEPSRMAREVERLLFDAPARAAMHEGLAEVRRRLGKPGAIAHAADLILADARLTPLAAPGSEAAQPTR